MKFRSLLVVLFISFALFAGTGAAAPDVSAVMQKGDVLPYLDQMIAWYRRAEGMDVSAALPRELLFRNSLEQHATKALAASFNFSLATAEIIDKTPATPPAVSPAPPPAGANAPSGAPQQHGIGQAIAATKKKIADLKTQKATAATDAERKTIDDETALDTEHLNLLTAISDAVGAADEENESLTRKIQLLAGTLPEVSGEQAKPAGQTAIVTQTARATPGGIAALAVDLYDFMQEKMGLQALRKETQALYDANRVRSQAIRKGVQDMMTQGSDLAEGKENAGGPANLTFDDLLAEMKEYSSMAVALSQMNIALKNCNSDLTDWIDVVCEHIHSLLRNMLWRVALLGVIILGMLALSALASRATKRYVMDERRRHQLRTVRKGVLGVAIALVVFLAVFTDFNSLATFAGLLTAGLAVACQNVLLSIIAYFQFFGSFGLRPGDRITISGVTGKVMQIGLLRFNLMELRESDIGYLPSGRVVGFSNSILFQPTPFFRQTPGTNFVWTEMNLMLDSSVDYEATYKKLAEVVQKVYGQYGAGIKLQETALESTTKLKAEVSVPQTYLKITNSGVAMVIRYAVQREQEGELHLKMTEELLAAIKKDPDMKFVNIS